MEKTGILGSWILRNTIQYHQIEEHFDKYPAYLDLNAGKLYLRMQIILKCSSFALLNTYWLGYVNQIEEH